MKVQSNDGGRRRNTVQVFSLSNPEDGSPMRRSSYSKGMGFTHGLPDEPFGHLPRPESNSPCSANKICSGNGGGTSEASTAASTPEGASSKAIVAEGEEMYTGQLRHLSLPASVLRKKLPSSMGFNNTSESSSGLVRRYSLSSEESPIGADGTPYSYSRSMGFYHDRLPQREEGKLGTSVVVPSQTSEPFPTLHPATESQSVLWPSEKGIPAEAGMERCSVSEDPFSIMSPGQNSQDRVSSGKAPPQAPMRPAPAWGGGCGTMGVLIGSHQQEHRSNRLRQRRGMRSPAVLLATLVPAVALVAIALALLRNFFIITPLCPLSSDNCFKKAFVSGVQMPLNRPAHR